MYLSRERGDSFRIHFNQVTWYCSGTFMMKLVVAGSLLRRNLLYGKRNKSRLSATQCYSTPQIFFT